MTNEEIDKIIGVVGLKHWSESVDSICQQAKDANRYREALEEIMGIPDGCSALPSKSVARLALKGDV